MNSRTRRQSKTEAAIGDETMAFRHDEFVGCGPDRVGTYAVEDPLIVRGFGAFAPAEKRFAESSEGHRPIKALRQQVLEAGRGRLEGTVEKHAGAKEAVSVHPGISTKSGEWVGVFVLDGPAKER